MFSSDEEAIDAVKRWWRENGAFVIAGLVIGVALIAGWRFWQASMETQAAEAGNRVEQVNMAAEMGDFDQAATLADELLADYRRTSQAAHGALRVAALAVDTGRLEEAADYLRWAVDNGRDQELAKLARVRLARVYVALDDPQSALDVLDGVDPGRYVALFEEARGDALLAAGEPAAAREAYGRALDADNDEFGASAALEMKYHDLAGYQD
ncbi:tetratricopeptide repeat protein [Gammaproteobacteria bacterium AB-CW1]|uniref:Ancillary SecYEG translocon subunit n=1 Tax=Natronospira elongata TaxID=3110268 RepID=A0AAP6MJW0_9GAMM|nr:tetratricopeptide repeat protein [Gammaproteobacteria bacterium AB-CW1]